MVDIDLAYDFLVDVKNKRLMTSLAKELRISRQTLTSFALDKRNLENSKFINVIYERACRGNISGAIPLLGNVCDILGKIFEIEEGHNERLKKYAGKYETHRLNKNNDDTIVGVVEIYYCQVNMAWLHRHESKQEINGVLKEFNHIGPAFIFGSRLYLIGIGKAANGSRYLRPNILRAVDDPTKEHLMGIVLTETAANPAPLASKIAFRHQKLSSAEGSVLADLVKDLKNEAESSHILYGWSG